MRIINLTPHAITLADEAGEVVRIDPSSPPARVRFTKSAYLHDAMGVAVHAAPLFRKIVGLPPPEPDTIYVVSQITAHFVAAVMPDRIDVVYPAAAPRDGAARSEKGVLHVNKLIRAN